MTFQEKLNNNDERLLTTFGSSLKKSDVVVGVGYLGYSKYDSSVQNGGVQTTAGWKIICRVNDYTPARNDELEINNRKFVVVSRGGHLSQKIGQTNVLHAVFVKEIEP